MASHDDPLPSSPPVSLRRRAVRDSIAILLLCLAAFWLAAGVDAFETLARYSAAYEELELDELLTLGFVLALGFGVFAVRRMRDLRREMVRREAAERAAQTLAQYDALTGLSNRRRLQEQAARLVARAARGGPPVAAFAIDLDGFKRVNDLLGHAAGDALLAAVAARLAATVRPSDEIARPGGDEFLVLLRLENGVDQAERIARRIVAALGEPFAINGGTVRIGASVGVAIAPADTVLPELLLAHADTAMYRAKAEGRNTFRCFEPGMDRRVRERARLEQALRQAIDAGRIRPYYQPLHELSGGRLIGFEALARWRGEDGQFVPPDQFIPLAEDSGLITPLTLGLLRQAFADAAAWPADVGLSVNVSPLLLSDLDLPARLAAMAAEAGLDLRRVEIEFTETAIVANPRHARQVAAALKQAGIQLALDDFGTGYSSLANLRALPFDRIKIDRSFVARMLEDKESEKIVAASIALGRSLGLPLTAEGIEDQATAARLLTMGCSVGQGWLFGKAMPPDAAARLGHARESGMVDAA
jgi:diguanylate cyclase (GGDEF)-like protein